MKHYSKILLILCSAIAFFSCSDEFVNDKLDISGVAESAIILSPEWEADDYEFKCKGVKSAEFTILSQPEWLILDSRSGNITDSIATVHASASTDPRFSKIGFYVDQMIVEANDKQYAVPVYYITEGSPAVQVNSSFEINYNNYNNVLQISNTGDGILLWDINSIPNWLTIDMNQFSPSSVILGKGLTASLPLSLNIQAAMQNNLQGTIVLQTNDKNKPLVEIAVKANLGNPSLNYYGTPIDFGSTQTTYSSRISNQGSGILVWNFEGLPEWLSVSTNSGTLMPYYSSNDFTFTCDRTKLQSGMHTAIFYLKSNDPSKASMPITVTVRVAGINANVKALEGNIIDVAFDKNTNTLYYVTSLPNKLVTYDVTSKTVLHEVALSKAPTSLAVSDDFTKAAVGHGGLISAINLANYTVTKTIDYGFSIYDIAWAQDDWFCYTKAGSYFNNMLWVNVSTLQTAESDDYEMDGGTNMKKVPNQPYVVAARRESSPTGITVFDINTKLEKNYRHQSIGNFWFINDGQYMVDASGSVYSTTAMVTAAGRLSENLGTIGKLAIPGASYWYNLPWIDHSSTLNSLWAIDPESAIIYQFEDNDYTLVKTYAYDDLYQPDAQSTAYNVVARYVFANSEGTELSVLRKGENNTTWSVEFIKVQ